MLGVKLLVLLIGVSCVCCEKAVICYYGTWATYRHGLGKFDVEHINPFLCTHLIYTFAGINNQGNVISLDPYLDLPDNWGRDNFGKFNALKLQNPKLKTLLAVGGWNEGSGKYSVMAANPTLRRNFIESSLRMVRNHGFDGLDFDWEYPNRRDTVHGVADIQNYSQLLKELREEYDKYGLLLTAAVSSVRDAASQSYDIPEISKYLDILNVMTYDMYGAWDPVTGHNSPLHKGEGDENARAEDLYTVDQALTYWISAGCPPQKLAVGVPFYGRTFRLTNANVNGVRAPSSGAGIAGPFTATSGTIGYNEFCNMLQTDSTWDRRYDDLAKVPYAVRGNDWVSYDNADSISKKIEFAKSLGIDKVVIWSIETDDFHGICGDVNALLTTINVTLENGTASTTPNPEFTPTTVSQGTTTTSTSVSTPSTTVPESSSTTSMPQTTTSTASSTTPSISTESTTTSVVSTQSTTTVIPSSESTGASSTTTPTSTVTSTTPSTTSTTVFSTDHTSATACPTKPATEVTSTEAAAATTTEMTVSEEICSEDGFASNPTDCTSFYMCITDGAGGLVAKEFKCPANLYWDQKNFVCNYPDVVECNV